MTPPTELHRTRTKLLSGAYGNTDIRYQLLAFRLDQALAALGRNNPAETEELAAVCPQWPLQWLRARGPVSRPAVAPPDRFGRTGPRGRRGRGSPGRWCAG